MNPCPKRHRGHQVRRLPRSLFEEGARGARCRTVFPVLVRVPGFFAPSLGTRYRRLLQILGYTRRASISFSSGCPVLLLAPGPSQTQAARRSFSKKLLLLAAWFWSCLSVNHGYDADFHSGTPSKPGLPQSVKEGCHGAYQRKGFLEVPQGRSARDIIRYPVLASSTPWAEDCIVKRPALFLFEDLARRWSLREKLPDLAEGAPPTRVATDLLPSQEDSNAVLR